MLLQPTQDTLIVKPDSTQQTPTNAATTNIHQGIRSTGVEQDYATIITFIAGTLVGTYDNGIDGNLDNDGELSQRQLTHVGLNNAIPTLAGAAISGGTKLDAK